MTIFHWPIFRVLPLFFFRRLSNTKHLMTGDYSFLVAALLLLASIIFDWLMITENPVFMTWGFFEFASELFLLVIFVYLVSKSDDCYIPSLTLYSLLLEIWLCIKIMGGVFFVLIDTYYSAFDYWNIFSALFFGWKILAVSSLFLLCFSKNTLVSKGYLISYIAIVIAPVVLLSSFQSGFWDEDYSSDYEEKSYYYDDYKYDEILYKQDELIKQRLSGVYKNNPNKIDMYYLGFASYASQSVFKNEVDYIDRLFSNNFYQQNHGINLINHKDTISNQPLAIKRNIQQALNGLSQKMGEEDILFFYLTSHGSKDHKLAVSFYPFRLVDITPEILRTYLDESSIKWRVLVVSACYSGGFVDDLKDDYTLIATAASAKDTSFGCDDQRDFTYFGEALFKDNLSMQKPIIQSFSDAITTIEKREKDEGKSPSNPQLWIGEKIQAHLEVYQNQ